MTCDRSRVAAHVTGPSSAQPGGDSEATGRRGVEGGNKCACGVRAADGGSVDVSCGSGRARGVPPHATLTDPSPFPLFLLPLFLPHAPPLTCVLGPQPSSTHRCPDRAGPRPLHVRRGPRSPLTAPSPRPSRLSTRGETAEPSARFNLTEGRSQQTPLYIELRPLHLQLEAPPLRPRPSPPLPSLWLIALLLPRRNPAQLESYSKQFSALPYS